MTKRRRLTSIVLADPHHNHRTLDRRPLDHLLRQQSIILVRLARDILPPQHLEPVAHIRNEHAHVGPRPPRVDDELLHGADQLARRPAPPAEVVEAQVQRDDVGRVRRDDALDLVGVEPRRAAVDCEVGAAAAGAEEGVYFWVVGAPGLRVLEVYASWADDGG